MKVELAILVLANLAMCQPAAQESDSLDPVQPDDPTVVDGHNRGSSMCGTIDHDECNKAIEFFKDEQRYKEHTEITVGYAHIGLFGSLGWITGCKAEYYCDDNVDYETGISGQGIKDA